MERELSEGEVELRLLGIVEERRGNGKEHGRTREGCGHFRSQRTPLCTAVNLDSGGSN